MPSARNLGWYALNATRPYPLDDSALLTDDNGLEIPFDVIVDLYLLFPDSLGQYAFLSSLTVSKGIVTATFQATPNPAALPGCVSPGVASSGFVPLASVSVPQKGLTPFRQYQLDAQNNGVGGWIVFGSGVQNFPYYGRFSTPQQSMVSSRCGKKYFQLPVQGLGKMGNASTLDDMVLLKGGSDIEIVTAAREVNGQAKNVIVVRLKDTESPDTNRNVFDIYKGPCGGRPESGSCGDPQPIEFIGPVGPDCCGNITLEFKGCADVAQITNDCGVILDCGFGLIDACVKPQWLPKHGILPNEYADLCAGYSLVSHSHHFHSSSYGYQQTPDCSLNLTPGLPLIDYFGNQTATGFQVIQGTWGFIEDESLETPCLVPGTTPRYAYWSRDPSQLNLSIWQTGITNWIPYNKGMTAAVKLRQGLDGTLHNGALVFNYRMVPNEVLPPPIGNALWPEVFKPGQTTNYSYTVTVQGVKPNPLVYASNVDVSEINTTYTVLNLQPTPMFPFWSAPSTFITVAGSNQRQIDVSINGNMNGVNPDGSLYVDYSLWIEVDDHLKDWNFNVNPGLENGAKALFKTTVSGPISGALNNYIVPFYRYIYHADDECPFDFTQAEVIINQAGGQSSNPNVPLPSPNIHTCAICVGASTQTISVTLNGFTGCCASLNGTYTLYFVAYDSSYGKPSTFWYSMAVPFQACNRMFFLQVLFSMGPPHFAAKVIVELREAYAKIECPPYIALKNDLPLFSQDCQNLDLVIPLELDPMQAQPVFNQIPALCDAVQSGITATITSGGISPPSVPPAAPPIQPPADGSFVPDYWMADLNFDGYLQGDKVLRIAHVHNGIVDTRASVSLSDLQLDSWYILDVKIQRILKGVTEFRRITSSARAATTNVVLGSVQYDELQSDFAPETGVFGLQADRATTEFSWAEIYNICGLENYNQKCIYVKDVLGLYTTAGIAHTWSVAIVNVIGFADILSVLVNRTWTRAVVDVIGVTDVNHFFPIQIWTRSFADVIGFNDVVHVGSANIQKLASADVIGMADHAGGTIAFIQRINVAEPIGMVDVPTLTVGHFLSVSTFSVIGTAEPVTTQFNPDLGPIRPTAMGGNLSVYAGGMQSGANNSILNESFLLISDNTTNMYHLYQNVIHPTNGIDNGLLAMVGTANPHTTAYFTGGGIYSDSTYRNTVVYTLAFTTLHFASSTTASLPVGLRDLCGLTDGQLAGTNAYFLGGHDSAGSCINASGNMYSYKMPFATETVSAVSDTMTYGVRYAASCSGQSSEGYLMGGQIQPWSSYGGPTGHIPTACGAQGDASDSVLIKQYATDAISLSSVSFLNYGRERAAAGTDAATVGYIIAGTTVLTSNSCWPLPTGKTGVPIEKLAYATGIVSVLGGDPWWPRSFMSNASVTTAGTGLFLNYTGSNGTTSFGLPFATEVVALAGGSGAPFNAFEGTQYAGSASSYAK